MLTNPPVPYLMYDLCIDVPISCLPTVGYGLFSIQPGEGPSRGLLRDCKSSRNLV